MEILNSHSPHFRDMNITNLENKSLLNDRISFDSVSEYLLKVLTFGSLMTLKLGRTNLLFRQNVSSGHNKNNFAFLWISKIQEETNGSNQYKLWTLTLCFAPKCKMHDDSMFNNLLRVETYRLLNVHYTVKDTNKDILNDNIPSFLILFSQFYFGISYFLCHLSNMDN